MSTTITHRIVTALAAPGIAGGILLAGLSAASPAAADPVGSLGATCFTTGSTSTTPNSAGPLTRPALVSTVEPGYGVFAVPRACFGS